MLTIRTPLGDEVMALEEFEDRVRKGDVPPDTLVCFPAVAGDRWVRARDLEVFKGLYDPIRIYFTRYFRLSRFPMITSAMILANLAVFGIMVLLFPHSGGVYSAAAMVDLGAKAPALIFDLGQTWRLLTANFVHRDALHLVFNLFVLFNVGGALENTFRPLQYAAVLLASALSTTILSLVGSDSVSAGASGVVFGCLGGLVVFGLKYREIIPLRYRRFFGAAVAPYVFVFLWMGWFTHGVDNWGHLGGLIGGATVTAVMRPRLLMTPSSSRWRQPVLGAALASVILLVVGFGPVFSGVLSRTAVHRDDISGMSLRHPSGWRHVVTGLGELGLGNGLPDPVWVQARYEMVEPPVNLANVADRWMAEQLHRAEQAGRVRSGRWGGAKETSVGGVSSLRYEVVFEAERSDGLAEDYRLLLYAFARGDLTYILALAAPERRFDSYHPVLRDIVGSIRLEEPRFLMKARAGVLLEPESSHSRDRLESALRRVGCAEP